jgi:phosphoserine phosphatase RsbU/P
MGTGLNLVPLGSALDFSLNTGQVEGLTRLGEWAEKLTSTLEFDLLVDQIVNQIACALGCVEANLYLYDEARGELALQSVCGCTAHGKGHRLGLGVGIVGHVARTRAMHYAPDVGRDPYYIECEKSTLSEVAIPLVFEGKLLGVFSAAHNELNAFSPERLGFVQSLAGYISIAVHNCRRFEQEQRERQRMSREQDEARSIQQALLPKASPYVPGFAISGLSVPAGEVGGDWYDFIALDDGGFGLVLADVSGKGMAAALLMSATRGMLRSLAYTSKSPAEVLGKLNRLMVDDFPSGRFVTLIYAVLDPERRSLSFSNAGHLPPLFVDGNGRHFVQSELGMPLGLAKGEFSESRLALAPGSRLLLYSDGITETTSPDQEEYGPWRLAEQVVRQEVSPDGILADVRRHAGKRGLEDDATVILVKA